MSIGVWVGGLGTFRSDWKCLLFRNNMCVFFGSISEYFVSECVLGVIGDAYFATLTFVFYCLIFSFISAFGLVP